MKWSSSADEENRTFEAVDAESHFGQAGAPEILILRLAPR